MMEKKIRTMQIFEEEYQKFLPEYYAKKADEQIENSLETFKFNRNEICVALMRANGRNFVYMLEKNKEIIYVGRSKRLYDRLVSHKSKKDFDTVLLIEYQENSQSVDAEFFLIKHHRPILNKLWVTYGT